MLQVEIEEGGTTLIHTDSNGIRHVKSIDLSELVKVLSSNTALDMGFLPIGTRYIGVKGDQVHVVIERPKGEWDVSFHGRGGPQPLGKATLPAAVIFYVLTKANDAYYVNSSYIFAMKQNNVMLGLDALYKYPTPNIFEDQHICWGQNEESIKNFKSLAALNGATRRFFTAPFNHDLFRRDLLTRDFPWDKVVAGEDVAEIYLKWLVSQNKFDDNWLAPAPERFKTFDAAVKTIFKGVVDL